LIFQFIKGKKTMNHSFFHDQKPKNELLSVTKKTKRWHHYDLQTLSAVLFYSRKRWVAYYFKFLSKQKLITVLENGEWNTFLRSLQRGHRLMFWTVLYGLLFNLLINIDVKYYLEQSWVGYYSNLLFRYSQYWDRLLF
jgi:hypothetical protein